MFDHYIAVDWAQNVMAIARLSKEGKNQEVFEIPADIRELKFYLRSKKGRKYLTFEESTCAQWMYSELKDEVEKLEICDPRRNRYLTEAQQTDKIDALKLAELGRAGLLKPVFHSGESFINLRKLISGYEDTVRAGVRLKNQRSAILRSQHATSEEEVQGTADRFVLQGLNSKIESYEEDKKRYLEEFGSLCKKNNVLKKLRTIPGIDIIGAVKIAARVVDPKRFATKQQFYAYCGLVKYEKISGGKSYGKKRTSYCRCLKNVFDNAALVQMRAKEDSYFGRYVHHLISERRYPDHKARRAISRHVAAISLGVMKGKSYDPDFRRKRIKSVAN